MHTSLQEVQPNHQLAIQNTPHPTNLVVMVPKELLSFMFSGLNAQDFSNLRLVSKGWRNVVIDPTFAKVAHWYPELSKICAMLSKHLNPETFTFKAAFESLQSILTSPEPLHFEAYKDKLILKLDLLPKGELMRLTSLNFPLPPAYKNIMQSAMKIYHSYSPDGKAWAPWKEMATNNTSHNIINLTGVNLSPEEAFVTFRVAYVKDGNFSHSEMDKSIPEMFPVSCLEGKKEGDILDFKLIDGKRFLHTLSGHTGAQLEDTLVEVGQYEVHDLSPKVLGHVLLPDLLDQLKVSANHIANVLMAEIDSSKYPDFKGKMIEFHEKIKTLETMPDLEVLKEELKTHLKTIDTEDLTKTSALSPLKGNRNLMGLPKEDIVRIPERWETIVKEIVEERKG